MPVGSRPKVANAGYLGQFLLCGVPFPAGKQQLNDEAMPMREAAQVIDHFQMWFEARLGDFGWFYFEVIDHGNAIEDIEVQTGIVTEVLGNARPIFRGDDDVRIESCEVPGLQNRPELLFEVMDNVGGVHSGNVWSIGDMLSPIIAAKMKMTRRQHVADTIDPDR
jgi:hypothetical protein